MAWLGEAGAQPFLVRALLAAALAGALLGYLGVWIVLRGWSLATEALAHALFPGLAVAAVCVGLHPVGVLAGGVLSALLLGGGAELLTRSSRLRPDAALGILYPLGYALGLVVLSVGKVRAELAHWLFGDLWGLAGADLWLLWGAALVIVPLFAALERPLLLATFQPDVAHAARIPVRALGLVFACAVVIACAASFRAAGVVPMVALAIAPAATLRLLTDRVSTMLWGSAALGLGGAVSGVLLAYAADLSGAATIALLLGAIFLLVLLFAPGSGLLARRRRTDHWCADSLRRWHRPTVAALSLCLGKKTADTRKHIAGG
jgi:ABC-type Mn2+/Zn2+ transport system permease subunit